MSFFGRLVSLAAAAGTIYFAKKVVDKVSENNPDGIPDSNANGKVDLSDYATEVRKAAGDVCHEAAETVRQKAPDAIENIKQTADEAKETIKDTYYGVKNAFSKPPEVIEIHPDSVTDAEEEKKDEHTAQS